MDLNYNNEERRDLYDKERRTIGKTIGKGDEIGFTREKDMFTEDMTNISQECLSLVKDTALVSLFPDIPE